MMWGKTLLGGDRIPPIGMTSGGARWRPVALCGFTIVELMTVVAIAAIVLFMAVPAYDGYIERAKTAKAVGELAEIDAVCQRFFTEFSRFPATLAEIGMAGREDPWGNPYRYLNIANGGPGAQGKVRKDKNLVPVNSDFDLYSMGPDGLSKPPFTAKPSRDDIVRAGNGGYFGKAEDH